MIRTYKIGGEGRVVVLPRHLSPDGTNMRLESGKTFELDGALVDRFVRNGLRNGDLVDVTSAAGAEKGKAK